MDLQKRERRQAMDLQKREKSEREREETVMAD